MYFKPTLFPWEEKGRNMADISHLAYITIRRWSDIIVMDIT